MGDKFDIAEKQLQILAEAVSKSQVKRLESQMGYRTKDVQFVESGNSSRNWAQCRQCKQVIESRSRHDFVSCDCGAISVDGGHDYHRRVGNPKDFEEPSKDYKYKGDWDENGE